MKVLFDENILAPLRHSCGGVNLHPPPVIPDPDRESIPWEGSLILRPSKGRAGGGPGLPIRHALAPTTTPPPLPSSPPPSRDSSPPPSRAPKPLLPQILQYLGNRITPIQGVEMNPLHPVSLQFGNLSSGQLDPQLPHRIVILPQLVQPIVNPPGDG